MKMKNSERRKTLDEEKSEKTNGLREAEETEINDKAKTEEEAEKQTNAEEVFDDGETEGKRKLSKLAVILMIAASVVIAAVFLLSVFGEKPVAAEKAGTDISELKKKSEELSHLAEETMREGTEIDIVLGDDASYPSGVYKNENDVIIAFPGIYRISGGLSEGSLSVYTEGKVTLILDGVEITNSTCAAIDIKDAEHTHIYLAEESENIISSGIERELSGEVDTEAKGAAIYSKDDISFSGTGALTVYGYINNAIASADDLMVSGGEMELYSANNGLKANDSLCITGGTLKVTSMGDGIQAGDELYIEDGAFDISAGDMTRLGNEERQREYEPQMPGKMPDVNSEATEKPSEMPEINGEPPEKPGERRNGDEPEKREREQGFPREAENITASEDDGASTKGIKSKNGLYISGGAFTVNSVDDCIHSDGSIKLSGGSFVLNTNDDGIHANETLLVSGGVITVESSYEGFEAKEILIEDGNISITSSDDGMNASNGEGDFSFGKDMKKTGEEITPASLLKISGGTVYVNANGDGLDSNGDLIIEGGQTTVDGPSDGANSALDSGTESGGKLSLNGGTILAIGSSRMAESFGEGSTECSFIIKLDGNAMAGSKITVSDESGNILIDYTSKKSFDLIVFGSPELTVGKNYTVKCGEYENMVTIEQVTNKESGEVPQKR